MKTYRVERWSYEVSGHFWAAFAHGEAHDAVEFPTWREAYDYAYARTHGCHCGAGTLYDCDAACLHRSYRLACVANPRRRRR